MNRTDRLYALREELRAAGQRGKSADALAASFEVSVRTIKRDISALQQGGFPVWARLGRRGGYVVDAQATLPPINITAAEATALSAALASHRGQPFSAQAQAALTKILAVMEESTRERSAALAGRIWTTATPAPSHAAVHSAIETALQDRRQVALRYRDEAGSLTQRRVDPQLLARTDDRWYLVAYCTLREDIRWFRLDRILQATLTTMTAREIPLAQIGAPPEGAAPVR